MRLCAARISGHAVMGSQLNTSVPTRLAGGKNTTAEKLLVAASELMIERASIEVSLSDIAQKSGVNAALVKYHFGNKDGLLLALLARDAATEMSQLEYLISQPISPTAKLRLHIGGIIRAYHQFPYMNRLIHYLLHESSAEAADEVSKFFVAPLLDFHRRLLAEGVKAGEFRNIDPVLFYTSLIGACDHLFFGRHAMSRATGVGPVTDDVCREYIKHMEALICGGMLNGNEWRAASSEWTAIRYSLFAIRKSREETLQGKVVTMQLQDVAVLITGGGSGLGAATARAMAAKGAKIGVIDQNKENAEKVAAEVKGVALHADVTDEEAIKAAIAKAEAAHGIARVLMNCAGIGGSQRTVGKDGVYPLAKFVRIINVNLIGTFNVLRLFAERLATAPPIGEERGVAINTASVAAYEGQIGQIAYSASKGGVVGLTLPAARDLASLKIRVNTIAPGLFLTPLLMGLNEEARKSLGAQVPHPARLGDASEYGNLAVHIVENPMLNGETIRLDGAIRMAPR